MVTICPITAMNINQRYSTHCVGEIKSFLILTAGGTYTYLLALQGCRLAI
jgi:hypothetical protein